VRGAAQQVRGTLPRTVSDAAVAPSEDVDCDEVDGAPESEAVAAPPFRASILTVGEDVRTTAEVLDDSTAPRGSGKAHYRLGGRVPDYDPNTVPGRFVGLFPFGTGGPAEHRERKVGFERYIKHAMKLARGQFSGSQRWCLEMFDQLQRSNAVGASLRAKVAKPEEVGDVSIGEVDAAIQARLAVNQGYTTGAALASGTVGQVDGLSRADRLLLIATALPTNPRCCGRKCSVCDA
jgi:hypothetical protein